MKMPRDSFRCHRCGRDTWKRQCHNSNCPNYLRGNRVRFKVGSSVVVKGHPRQRRMVVCVYTDIDGGRRLDKPVDGFVSWNVTNLRGAR